MRSAWLILSLSCWILDASAQVYSVGTHRGPQTPVGEVIPLENSTGLRELAVTTNAVGMVGWIAPGRYVLGLVRIDQTNRSVSFPAELNMNNGLLEYLLVTTSGKTHESLLRTKTDPLHIQLALLLLNAKPGELQIPKELTNSNPASAKAEPTPINDPSPIKLAGDPLQIEISWAAATDQKVFPAEALLLNEQTKKAITSPKWVFNGSRVAEKKFMAQVTGSVISLITDPDALINNQAPGHENDEIWGINSKLVPPLNHPVTVTLRPKNAPPAASSKE